MLKDRGCSGQNNSGLKVASSELSDTSPMNGPMSSPGGSRWLNPAGRSKLEDLAARFFQIPLGHIGDLEELRKTFFELASATTQPDAVRSLIAEALLRLDDYLYRGSTEAEPILEEVATFIVEASHLSANHPVSPKLP
ncbi:MAG: hypothetical protein ACE15E_00460 [Acidobacteriota bacterium]